MMSPELQKLRSERDLVAGVLMGAVRVYTKHTATLRRLQNTSAENQEILIDFRANEKLEQKMVAEIRQLTENFREVQAMWSIALHDKSTGTKAELAEKLKDLVFDWSETWRLGDQIDAAAIRWGSFGVAAQGGDASPVSEQICGMVASGATPKELMAMRHAVSHMPNVLGGNDYRHCCLVAMGLEWRMQGAVSNMDEINAMLHWYDRAEAMMIDTRKISEQFFQRMGVQ